MPSSRARAKWAGVKLSGESPLNEARSPGSVRLPVKNGSQRSPSQPAATVAASFRHSCIEVGWHIRFQKLGAHLLKKALQISIGTAPEQPSPYQQILSTGERPVSRQE